MTARTIETHWHHGRAGAVARKNQFHKAMQLAALVQALSRKYFSFSEARIDRILRASRFR